MKNISCVRHEGLNSGADFSFNKFGNRICCVVKYVENGSEIQADIDRMNNNKESYNPQLMRGFKQYGTIPRTYYAVAKCISSDDGTSVAGGEYEITYRPVQWLNSDVNSDARNLSDRDLVKGYANAWKTGDVQFLSDYLSASFTADSEVAFEEITSKSEYIDYFSSTQNKYKYRGLKVDVELVTDDETGEHGVLIWVNEKINGFVMLTIEDFRIVKAHTKRLPASHTLWTPAVDLYQTHGDHHEPFLSTSEISDYIYSNISNAKPTHKAVTNVCFEKGVEKQTVVASLKIGKEYEEIKYLAIIAYNAKKGNNEIMSLYPYMPGKSTIVKVLDVLEWDNKIEATIKCRYEKNDECFDFYFFATDYFANKKLYQLGKSIEVSLVASSADAKIASKGFSFEGQSAIDFLAKLGKTPEYDESGDVKPVNFSTEKMIAYIIYDEKCPEDVQFQSPTEAAKPWLAFFYGKRCYRQKLITLNEDTELKVPIFFPADFDVQDGDPLTGHLWMTGRLSYSGRLIETYSNPISLEESLRYSLFTSFDVDFEDYNLFTGSAVPRLLERFKELSMDETYRLYCAKVGTATDYYIQLYVTHPVEYFDRHLFPEFDANEVNDHPRGFVNEAQKDTIPTLLGRLKFTGDKNGIWEAFVLYMSPHILPRKGKFAEFRQYISGYCSCLYNGVIRNSQYHVLSLIPYFYLDKKSMSGSITIHYWDDYAGLFREVYTFIYNEGVVSFELDQSYNLIEYENNNQLFCCK
jgi:hypothetical protein